MFKVNLIDSEKKTEHVDRPISPHDECAVRNMTDPADPDF